MTSIFEKHIEDKVCVVLESSGKIKSVQALLEQFGFSDFDVVATFGRLFDLPSDSLGVSLENFSEITRVQIGSERISYLKKMLAKASLVLVITDDDIEGELIASDVFNIADLVGHKSQETIFRLRLKAISFQQFVESLNLASGVNSDVVKGALARRTFDRICGYSISSNDYSSYNGLLHGRVGRVLTPLLSILSRNDSNSQSFGYIDIFDDNHKKWCLEIFDNDREKIISKCRLLSTLQAPRIRKISAQIVEDKSAPMNFGSALSSISRASKISIARASACLQSLYQDGSISYHRTDSSVILKSSANEIGKVAFRHGIAGFNSETLILSGGDPLEDSQNAHHAIVPLKDIPSLYSKSDSLSEQDFILMLIWRNIIRSGQSNRMIEINSADIDISNELGKLWALHLSDIDYSISRSESFILGCNRKNLINDRIYINGSNCTTKLSENSGFYIEPNDHKVLRLMIENGLGRPSTFPVYASSFSRLFLDDEGSVNALGESSLLLAKHFCNGLIDPEISRKIEYQLHFGAEDIQKSIMMALSMAQIDLSKSMSGYSDISSEKEANFIL